MSDSSSYVSIDLFEECVPPFQAGLRAKERLESDEELTRAERAELKRAVREGETAWIKVIDNVEWIINNAIRDEMEKPRAFHYIPDTDELRQAGREGVYMMLKNADLTKMQSAVNYLMQWVSTYVKRAASKDEAQFGLSSSKLQVFRKISAIRSKMADELGRAPTDEEVHEYVTSGKAHVKTYMGRKGKGSDTTRARRADNIPLSLIQEQAQFEDGYPMKFAVTDPVKVDSIAHLPSIEDTLIQTPTQEFWNAWFEHVGIIQSQWLDIAESLDLYHSKDKNYKLIRNHKQLASEVKLLLASQTGGIKEFAQSWSDSHGTGPWDVFTSITLLPKVDMNAVDEHGKKVFRTLQFVQKDK